MTVRRAGWLWLSILVFTALAAQTPAAAQTTPATVPTRDRPAEAPRGTATLRGRVVSADGSAPLRRAQVRAAAIAVRTTRLTSTDAEGRYEFTNLPAGRYTVTVNKAGYVGLEFGQRRPFEGGRPLDLADGQVVENIDFALPLGSVITGRITDEAGDPIIGAYVQAMRYSYMPGGRRQLVAVNLSYLSNISNDMGEFRLFGLMPVAYVVSAHSSSAGVVSLTQLGPQTRRHRVHRRTRWIPSNVFSRHREYRRSSGSACQPVRGGARVVRADNGPQVPHRRIRAAVQR